MAAAALADWVQACQVAEAAMSFCTLARKRARELVGVVGIGVLVTGC
jgi:hypothetical protein